MFLLCDSFYMYTKYCFLLIQLYLMFSKGDVNVLTLTPFYFYMHDAY